MNHTPGPWTMAALLPDGRIVTRAAYEIRTDEFDVATHIPFCGPIRKEADARLIAAAPDLLEACKDALETLNALAHFLNGGEQDSIELLLLAIAKATGEDAT